ncbi:nucleotidyl transferase AbiEii/AbiGii toxin family protein [bacterium]|nr:nucleotidyl transferase AbiEii/AbiGii toxin family protein [bacterium]
MKSILEEQLANEINELKKKKLGGQKIVNSVKEFLHIIVLNYLYSHKIYKNSVMYSGSALRHLYQLERMSVDLDFQINFPLNPSRLEKDIKAYFENSFGYKKLGMNVSATSEKDTDVIWITFSELDKFKIPDIGFTKLKIRLDFNKFNTEKFAQILIPIKKDNYEFSIRTYSSSTLMASKIAALFNRVGYCVPDGHKSISANYKGRDIYDLIWYLQKGVVPNLAYLKEKGLVYSDYPSLFKKIKERLSNLNDGGKALKADLTHLYLSPDELDGWMYKWNEFFLDSLRNYHFIKIKELELVQVKQNFDDYHFVFKYCFKTDQNKKAVFLVVVSDHYIEDFPIRGFKRDDIRLQISSDIETSEKQTAIEYAGLFYSKITAFLERINYVSPKLKLQTKFIQLGYGGYDPDTTVTFTDKELEACQFEDLL